MNREIEFRAWLKEYSRMESVIDLDFEYQQIGVDDFKSREYGRYLFIYFDKIELMQYTGLKDKNGKKIFEGDICKIYDHNGYHGTYPVVFERDRFVFRKDILAVGLYYPHIIEVIGNIYENKELIS